jgi:hypothetical protein
MTAAHIVRPAGKRPKVRAHTAPPEVVYPPGHFTAPVRAWKQLQFVSALSVDNYGHLKLLADIERARQRATGAGWGSGNLALPGTPDFVPDRAAARRAVP